MNNLGTVLAFLRKRREDACVSSTDAPTKSAVTVLPRAIKAWRAERRLSQEGLAAKAQMSAGMIALIETGRRQPGIGNLLAIAAALDVEPEALAIIHVDLSPLLPDSTEAGAA